MHAGWTTAVRRGPQHGARQEKRGLWTDCYAGTLILKSLGKHDDLEKGPGEVSAAALLLLASAASSPTDQWICSHTASNLNGSSVYVAVYVTKTGEIDRSTYWSPARIAPAGQKPRKVSVDLDLSIEFGKADSKGLGNPTRAYVSTLTNRPVKWLEEGRATLTLPQGRIYIADISRTIKSTSSVFYSGDFHEIDADQSSLGDFETRLEAAPTGHVAFADRNGHLKFEANYVFSPHEKRESMYRTALAMVDEKLKNPAACDKTVSDPTVEFYGPIP